jgi:hypothetical protein
VTVTPDRQAVSSSGQQAGGLPGDAWRAILSRVSPELFAAAFVKEPVLVASVANAAVHGAAAIHDFFQVTAALYEHIAFVTEFNVAHRTFLAWSGKALGGHTVEGCTVIARDADGLIERVELYHRPLSIVVGFAQELERRLGERLGARLFAAPQ